MDEIKGLIRDIPDFPKKGIIFKDITPLLKDASAFNRVVSIISKEFERDNIDLIAAIEARGFIIGGAVANNMNRGFIPVRKAGKLPYKSYKVEYELEYGTDIIEMHEDAISNGNRVLIVDDLLATGGTAEGVIKLVERSGGIVVGIAFIIELEFLNGRKRLDGRRIFSIVKF
jgi:adenine phosphoribosyltransferase